MTTNFGPNILVSDVNRTARFLAEALGFKEIMRVGGAEPVWVAFERDGHRVMIETSKSPDPDNKALLERTGGRLAATVHFYLSVDDLDAEVARLKATGTSFKGPTQKPYGMREVAFHDPDGYAWVAGQRTEA
jgi:uncharacterized glyoxalase superfamily protein PhnB